jgi:uncharacterized phage-associated protein
MIRFQFDSIKTTQAAGHLLKRCGGKMSKGFLIKMLYLADRELLSKRGHPLTGDQPVSMKNGPVLTMTYDLTEGGALEHRAYWEQYIADDPSGHNCVILKTKPAADHLSKAETHVLDEVFDKFHDLTWQEFVEFCRGLPEWKNPGKSSAAIDFRTILQLLGKTKREISEIENQAAESQIMDMILTNHAAG